MVPLISTLRIFAVLCGSAVITLYSIFTAEPQSYAEIRKEVVKSGPAGSSVLLFRDLRA